jgi:hypothetical protein
MLACVLAAPILGPSAGAGEPKPPPRYTIQLLPSVDDRFVFPAAINDQGHIAGDFRRFGPFNEQRQPFLWTPQSGYQSIPALPGSRGFAYSTALNNSDQVVGYSNAGGSPASFYWSASTGTLELPIPLGGASGAPTGISDAGLVAINAQPRSYVWSKSTGSQFLPPLPGHTTTSTAAVNRQGQIVGASDESGTIWDRGANPQPTPLNESVFSLISNAGHLAAGNTIFDPDRGFTTVPRPDGQDFNSPPELLGINSSGIAVGRVDREDAYRALVYFPGEGSWELNDLVNSEVTLHEATAINDAGVIIGYGDDGAFILTPIAMQIPEPALLAPLVLGGVLLLPRRRRSSAALAALTGALFIAPPVSADYRTIAFTGAPAPHTENATTFLQLSPPVLSDTGDVSFQASLAGPAVDPTNDAAVYLGGSALTPTLQLLQRKGAPADPALGLGPAARLFVSSNAAVDFAQGPQAVAQRQLASFAYFAGPGLDYTNDTAILVGPPAQQRLAARIGDQAPGTPADVRFYSFNLPRINPSGQFLLPARLDGPNLRHDNDPSRFSNDDGIWYGGPSTPLTLLARAGDPAPSAPAGYVFSHTLYNGEARINSSGQVLLHSLLLNPPDTNNLLRVLYTGTPGNLRKVIATGDPTPGISDPAIRFRGASQIAFNDPAQIAFAGDFSGTTPFSPGGGSGIFLATPGASQSDPYTSQLLARSGAPAPGGDGLVFQFMGFPRLNDSGRVVFTAGLTRPDDVNSVQVGNGVWTATSPDDLKLVLRSGTHAPGIPAGDTISAFAYSLTNQNKILLGGKLAGPDVTPDNDDVWYLSDLNGVLSPLLREGDLIDPGDGVLRPASNISFFPSPDFDSANADSPFNDAGQLAFRVTFPDNSQAIVIASVPEPASAATALCLASSLLLTRRCRPARTR